MKSRSPPSALGANEALAALLETLHGSGQRPEDAASEVDALTRHDGRALQPRRAQDQLRRGEAAGQAAILDALPAHVALLDGTGIIVSVNEAWRRLVDANAVQDAGFGVGLNYLEICASAQGEGSAEAHQAAAGIRAVLAGELASFSIEHACHSPVEQRWFLMTVTPVAGPQPGGAVVMHLNITLQKRGEEELRRFGAAMNAIADAIYLVDRASMRFVHVNDAACRMQNQTREQLQVLGPEGVLGTTRAELERAYDAIIASGVEAKPLEMIRRRKDGSQVWVELRRHAQYTGERWMIVSLVRDITERKAADARIVHLNRVHAVLSGINTLIVRVRDRDELFKGACRIAVEEGGFRMAWIGIVERGGTRIVPLASAGVDAPLLSAIKDRYASNQGAAPGLTMADQAIRERKAVLCDDLQSNPKVLLRRRFAELGIHSLAFLPLVVAGEAVGVLTLYAAESEFFHEQELKLLVELADDIAFAIDHIDKQERLDYLAYYDVLTGLANRNLFHNRLSHSLHARGAERPLIAVVLLDLERFRQVNETLGRACGDQLLLEVGARLQRANDTAARIGIDMYGLILRGARTAAEVNRALEAVLAACFTEPYALGGEELRLTCRAGVVLYPDDGADADALLRNAEAALRRSKRSADRIVFYAPEMNARVAEALALESRLRRAIERREFVLHYQPKVALASGRITGVEALIRWQDAARGLVSPAEFIPVLEETGMIVEVGRWVVEQALVDLRTWSEHGIRVARVAVNVSAIQLQRQEFVDGMIEEIRSGGDLPERLELEVTESVVMRNVEDSTRKLSILRGMGVTVAIDDFGTGYSSLSYLSRLPLDSLKIDRSFVSGMTQGGDAASIVSTIIALAHGLKLKVVAEGVETREQGEMLRRLGCDEAQGFLYGRPMPAAEMETLMRSGRALLAPPAALRRAP